jgi:sedoheptulose-bisphosphatase
VTTVLVSPRKRAQKTFELLFACSEVKPSFQTDQRVREWTYGDYEGLFLHEIVDLRKKQGLAREEGSWDIWVDG